MIRKKGREMQIQFRNHEHHVCSTAEATHRHQEASINIGLERKHAGVEPHHAAHLVFHLFFLVSFLGPRPMGCQPGVFSAGLGTARRPGAGEGISPGAGEPRACDGGAGGGGGARGGGKRKRGQTRTKGGSRKN